MYNENFIFKKYFFYLLLICNRTLLNKVTSHLTSLTLSISDGVKVSDALPPFDSVYGYCLCHCHHLFIFQFVSTALLQGVLGLQTLHFPSSCHVNVVVQIMLLLICRTQPIYIHLILYDNFACFRCFSYVLCSYMQLRLFHPKIHLHVFHAKIHLHVFQVLHF